MKLKIYIFIKNSFRIFIVNKNQILVPLTNNSYEVTIRQGIINMISKIPSWKQPYGQNLSKKILNIILKNAKYKK